VPGQSPRLLLFARPALPATIDAVDVWVLAAVKLQQGRTEPIHHADEMDDP
jgi:hypothetical protein